MASTKEYLDYILDQLSELDEISYRQMMGEYLLYYRGKLVGGIYDNRLLLKAIPAVLDVLPNAPLELPYAGAKPMLLVEDPENRALLQKLFTVMEAALPASGKKRKSEPKR